MQEQHPLSPEDRRKRQAAETAAYGPDVVEQIYRPPTAWEIVKRVSIGVYNDGFIHAGNLAYLAILALFPFFILATAIAQLLGQSADGQKTVASVLSKLPPQVAEVLAGPVTEVLTVRTGPLLWFGAAVGLCRFCFVGLCKPHLVELYRDPPSGPQSACRHRPGDGIARA